VRGGDHPEGAGEFRARGEHLATLRTAGRGALLHDVRGGCGGTVGVLGSSRIGTGVSSSGGRCRPSGRVGGRTARCRASRSPSGPAPHAPAERSAPRSRVSRARTGRQDRAGRGTGCTRRPTTVSRGARCCAMSCSLLGSVAAAGEGTAGKEKIRSSGVRRPRLRTPRDGRVTEPLRGVPAAAGHRPGGRALVDRMAPKGLVSAVRSGRSSPWTHRRTGVSEVSGGMAG
jgi:hypothetical protein